MSQGPPRERKWPPTSPHEALLTSPSRRRRLEQRNRDVSPSPIKRPKSTSQLYATSRALPDDDEDEETLRLKLEEIQVKLKLKELQAKSNQGTGSRADTEGRNTQTPGSRVSSRTQRDVFLEEAVQVPLSPVHDRRTPALRGPAQELLGIEKRFKAQDVSLKRASSFSARLQNAQSGLGSVSRPSSQKIGGRSNVEPEPPIVKSFSERIAESRELERQKKEKEERLLNSRSRGFGLDRRDTPTIDSSRASSQQSTQSQGQRSFLRPGTTKTTDALHSTSRTPTPTTSASANSSLLTSDTSASTSHRSLTSKFSTTSLRPSRLHPSEDPSSTTPESTDQSLFESYSSLHLSKRLMPHTTLTRHLDGKVIYTIPHLLKEVKSPHYDPPDIESDYVVLGIIASKSTPLNHKKKYHMNSSGDPDSEAEDDQAAGRTKFMVMRLTDLHWELDMFLFATGFSEFWKLTVGTVVAILNPGIMPPKNKDAGNFSLKISSSEDSVMEIGSARDLGFCNALKKDGKECGSWVDLRKTEVCEFHISLAIDKAKRGRMEVNTMTGFGSRSGGSRKGMFGSVKGAGGTKRSDELKREGMFRDRKIHETVFIAPNAAKMLDDEDKDFGGALERGCSRAEQSRKRFAEKEKERELAKKLGQIGTGLGGEYMRRKGGYGYDPASTMPEADPNSKGVDRLEPGTLDLFHLHANEVSLERENPSKRKRVGNQGTAPVGWSGAFKSGLANPAKNTTAAPTSPTKKKARFMLEKKGIREPGRESLGGAGNTAEDEDDDDDLEII